MTTSDSSGSCVPSDEEKEEPPRKRPKVAVRRRIAAQPQQAAFQQGPPKQQPQRQQQLQLPYQPCGVPFLPQTPYPPMVVTPAALWEHTANTNRPAQNVFTIHDRPSRRDLPEAFQHVQTAARQSTNLGRRDIIELQLLEHYIELWDCQCLGLSPRTKLRIFDRVRLVYHVAQGGWTTVLEGYADPSATYLLGAPTTRASRPRRKKSRHWAFYFCVYRACYHVLRPMFDACKTGQPVSPEWIRKLIGLWQELSHEVPWRTPEPRITTAANASDAGLGVCLPSGNVAIITSKPKGTYLRELYALCLAVILAPPDMQIHCDNQALVSSVRQRDLHILTVGTYTHTSDQRFHSIHLKGSEDLILEVRYIQKWDAGV
ncbi:hypothetical protein HPB47_021669 [Ixodes persulcatus]|uniref:Uncharacterized protein n=1 Tax=Ixodes persulcatus TaxID=34615 RepID=A0AC60QBY2_IXOPE|nr:hypothetical protein HPB47_021669 [Ixodes persulcatus]